MEEPRVGVNEQIPDCAAGNSLTTVPTLFGDRGVIQAATPRRRKPEMTEGRSRVGGRWRVTPHLVFGGFALPRRRPQRRLPRPRQALPFPTESTSPV